MASCCAVTPACTNLLLTFVLFVRILRDCPSCSPFVALSFSAISSSPTLRLFAGSDTALSDESEERRSRLRHTSFPFPSGTPVL